MRILLALLVLLAAPAMAADHPANWSRPTEPVTLIGNVHYVGTEGLSAFLITGPAGHVLIDGGLPSSAPMILAGIRKLGFQPRDIKAILINHAHFDHAGGLAELKRATGAKLYASAGDKPDLEAGRTLGRPELDAFAPVKVDTVIANGSVVRVGPVALTAIATPGHTRGATSWTTTAAGRRVIFASSLTVAGQTLVGDPTYPNPVADFRRSFARLNTVRADVFLNFHSEGFGLAAKRAKRDFVDAGELQRQVAAAEAAFAVELKRQGVR